MDLTTVLAGRIEALEYLVVGLFADAIGGHADPGAVAVAVKSYCDAKVAALIAEGTAAGQPAGWPAAAFAGALLELRNRIIYTAAASRADSSGRTPQ